MRRSAVYLAVLTALLVGLVCFPGGAVAGTQALPQMPATPTTFAIIGDYGVDNANEAAVASLVASWGPAYVVATGDDYYSQAGGTGTGKYDESTGAYYGAWLRDITTTGTRCSVGLAPVNAFFPSMGNHDYSDAAPAPDTYLTYFTLPGVGFTNTSGNERYYDFVEGPVHFFVLNSNAPEPAGTSSTSTQATWLQAQLAASTSPWNIVYGHHPPYSSDTLHGSTTYMQWPFAMWGADAVISGHAHTYERIVRDGIVYFVNGLGGASKYGFGTPVTGSAVRYNADWGAQKVTVNDTTATFDFYNVAGTLIDSYTLTTPRTPPSAPTGLTATAVSASQINLAWTDNANNETGFKIERSPDGSTWAQIATVGAGAVTYANTGLNASTAYSYRIRAYNRAADSPYSNIASATTGAYTRYDQTNANIIKTGTWNDFTTPAAYLGSYGRSLTPGAKATIYFTGTKIAWIGMKGTTPGIIDVYLDGVKKATLDLVASPAKYLVTLWTSPTLTNGPHHMDLVRAKASLSPEFIVLDAVDIWGTIDAAPSAYTRYDQTNTNIVKTGTWKDFFTTGPSGGSYGRSLTPGAKATIYFTGTRIDWIGMKGVTPGIVQVYLDDVLKATLDLYAPSAKYQVMLWSSGPLTNGTHHMDLVRATASLSTEYLVLDAVDIWGTIKAGP